MFWNVEWKVNCDKSELICHFHCVRVCCSVTTPQIEDTRRFKIRCVNVFLINSLTIQWVFRCWGLSHILQLSKMMSWWFYSHWLNERALVFIFSISNRSRRYYEMLASINFLNGNNRIKRVFLAKTSWKQRKHLAMISF